MIVEPEELDDIAPGRSKALKVSGFVDLDTGPDLLRQDLPGGEQHGKVYALLQRALAEPNKAGIATFVVRGREYLVALTTDWDPEDFHDTFQEKVKALIEAKAAGKAVEKAEPAAQPTGVVDLMEALRASVEQARSPKDTGEKAGTSQNTGRGKKPAAKKRTGTSGASLRSLTKAELYEKATKAGGKGCSSMTHDQLADALAKDR